MRKRSKIVEILSAGDLVFACQPNVVELEKCATLLREAAIAKIVPGSLPS